MTLFAIGISMAIVCSVIGDFLIKQGSQELNEVDIKSFGGIWGLLNPLKLFPFMRQSGIFHNWKLILGIVVLSGHFGGYLLSMRTAPVVTVVPLMASTYIIDAILAKIILHERVTWQRWVGVGVVVAGVSSLVGVSGISIK
ncbi:MAG: EamA family transporter [Chroococcidiopsidaceae cyanobacterium CP_BM_ER_R8_30]|nr:EamA family transporter [Chroococcidiopsidaceae cyanobacterium CP_BM_ER_R8_30]